VYYSMGAYVLQKELLSGRYDVVTDVLDQFWLFLA
jgi:hypothetical protein